MIGANTTTCRVFNVCVSSRLLFSSTTRFIFISSRATISFNAFTWITKDIRSTIVMLWYFICHLPWLSQTLICSVFLSRALCSSSSWIHLSCSIPSNPILLLRWFLPPLLFPHVNYLSRASQCRLLIPMDHNNLQFFQQHTKFHHISGHS